MSNYDDLLPDKGMNDPISDDYEVLHNVESHLLQAIREIDFNDSDDLDDLYESLNKLLQETRKLMKK